MHENTKLASGNDEWTTHQNLAPVIWISPQAEQVQMMRTQHRRKVKQAHTYELLAAAVTAGITVAACLWMVFRQRLALPGIPPFGVGRNYPSVDGTENDTDEE